VGAGGPGLSKILYGWTQAFSGPIQKLLTITPCLILCQFFDTSVVQYNVEIIVTKCIFHD